MSLCCREQATSHAHRTTHGPQKDGGEQVAVFLPLVERLPDLHEEQVVVDALVVGEDQSAPTVERLE